MKSLLSPFGSIEKRGIPFSFSLLLQARSRETKESQKNRICRPQLGSPILHRLSGLLLSLPVIPHLISDILPHMTPLSSGETEDWRKRAVVDDQKVTRHSCCDRAKRSRPMIHGKTQGERPLRNLVRTLSTPSVLFEPDLISLRPES